MNTGTHALKVNKGVKEFPGERDKFTVTRGIYLGQNLPHGNCLQLWPYRTLPGVTHLQPRGHLPGNTDSLTPKEIIAHHPDTNMQKKKKVPGMFLLRVRKLKTSLCLRDTADQSFYR